MSGKPYPEGTTRVIEIVDRMNVLETEAEGLNKTIQEAQGKLQTANAEYRRLVEEFDKLIASMDLKEPGNMGYERRMAWFLVEIWRQAKKAPE
jgi:hypothetical protein